MTREEFESKCAALIGERVVHVFYYELEYEGFEQLWSEHQDFDSLDHGLDLVMESGSSFGITWGDEFYQYGISLHPEPLNGNVVNGARVQNVSASSRWTDYIGKPIVAVELEWSWVVTSDSPDEKKYYPQDMKLTFEGKKEIILSALEMRDGKALHLMDNITVFFHKGVWEHYGKLA